MSNVEAPVDKNGFTQRPPMTDLEVVIACLECPLRYRQASGKDSLDSGLICVMLGA